MDLRINDSYLIIFYNVVLILKYFCFHSVSNFNLNRTKYFMFEEIDVNLDLTEIFSLKKSSICSSGLNPLKKIQEYKYY